MAVGVGMCIVDGGPAVTTIGMTVAGICRVVIVFLELLTFFSSSGSTLLGGRTI
jgi:hypothetical protein